MTPVTQSEFRAALLDANVPAPDGLLDPKGAAAGSRFSVYRNNVVVSLREAMTTAFPLVKKLIGVQNFDNLSGLFVRAYPPKSPLMMHYGAEFPAFLEQFQPLAHIGYLPDCARLDLAMRRSYHAKDSKPLDPTRLQADPAEVMRLRLAPAPATQFLTSPWPLFDIWRFNTQDGAAKPQAVAQDVLVTRPEFDPCPHILPVGGARWLALLSSGATFGEATEQLSDDETDFDLAAVLAALLSAQGLIELTTKDTP
ncbi:MAG: DNA-binding domain-containing protein [Pseudomonadota bacterium]